MRNDELLSLFTPQTRRDKQIRVGASNLSNPCALCLAEDILPGIRTRAAWSSCLARCGNRTSSWGQDRNGYPPRSGVLGEAAFPQRELEQRFELGLYENHGLIGSTADAYDPEDGTIVDYGRRPALLKALSAVFSMHGDVPDVSGDSLRPSTSPTRTDPPLCARQGAQRRRGTVHKIKVVFISRTPRGVGRGDLHTRL